MKWKLIKITNSISKEIEEKFEKDLLSIVTESFISTLAKQIYKNYSILKDEE